MAANLHIETIRESVWIGRPNRWREKTVSTSILQINQEAVLSATDWELVNCGIAQEDAKLTLIVTPTTKQTILINQLTLPRDGRSKLALSCIGFQDNERLAKAIINCDPSSSNTTIRFNLPEQAIALSCKWGDQVDDYTFRDDLGAAWAGYNNSHNIQRICPRETT